MFRVYWFKRVQGLGSRVRTTPLLIYNGTILRAGLFLLSSAVLTINKFSYSL